MQIRRGRGIRGLSNGDGWSGIWTLDVKDATYALTCRPLDLPGKDCGGSTTDGVLEAGHLVDTDEQVAFVSDYGVLPPDAEIGCTRLRLQSHRVWTGTDLHRHLGLEDDLLLFTDGDGHGAATLLINPWVRIADRHLGRHRGAGTEGEDTTSRPRPLETVG